ncbi:MAG: hypothetical protein IPJ30_23065 [Acidobacteria bacterium]|nr:hypothetical protein [Acidobacteriota bacterium]
MNGESRDTFKSAKFGIATLAGIEIAAPIPVPANFWPNSDTVKLAMPIGKVLLKVESETDRGNIKVSYFLLDENGVFQPFRLKGGIVSASVSDKE